MGLDIGNARFAANVRACEGYAIVSEIAGVDSFVLVSGPEAEVQRLMLCPGAARAAYRRGTVRIRYDVKGL